ncbi:hypothetical protein [Oceanobacillus senegalensis]|uniref:hypothetical protein n=1 Tax=Oceanobacillus senegalensis TaxID=1936063 RepID=UPI0015C41CD3|nr:hypothetical protein [Oceanobacillus senegalensis]
MLIGFWQMCEEVNEQLGRKLSKEEFKFLKWMYACYLHENQEKIMKNVQNHNHL